MAESKRRRRIADHSNREREFVPRPAVVASRGEIVAKVPVPTQYEDVLFELQKDAEEKRVGKWSCGGRGRPTRALHALCRC